MVTSERADLLRVYDKTRVQRWEYTGSHIAFHAHVSLGWLPDGRCFVEDDREQQAWVFAGATSP